MTRFKNIFRATRTLSNLKLRSNLDDDIYDKWHQNNGKVNKSFIDIEECSFDIVSRYRSFELRYRRIFVGICPGCSCSSCSALDTNCGIHNLLRIKCLSPPSTGCVSCAARAALPVRTRVSGGVRTRARGGGRRRGGRPGSPGRGYDAEPRSLGLLGTSCQCSLNSKYPPQHLPQRQRLLCRSAQNTPAEQCYFSNVIKGLRKSPLEITLQ